MTAPFQQASQFISVFERALTSGRVGGTINLIIYSIRAGRARGRVLSQCLAKNENSSGSGSSANASISALRARRKRNLNFEKRTWRSSPPDAAVVYSRRCGRAQLFRIYTEREKERWKILYILSSECRACKSIRRTFRASTITVLFIRD